MSYRHAGPRQRRLLVKDVSRRLRLARHARGMRQKDLCVRTGLAYNTVYNAENAVGDCLFSTAIVICDALEVSLDDLVAGIPDVKDPDLKKAWK